MAWKIAGDGMPWQMIGAGLLWHMQNVQMMQNVDVLAVQDVDV